MGWGGVGWERHTSTVLLALPAHLFRCCSSLRTSPPHTTEKRDKTCASEVESPSTQRQRLHTLQKRFQLSGSRWHVKAERVALRRLRAPLLVVLLIVR